MKKRKNKILLLLVLLLAITIGFAALATTLKINGTASITKNTWNIYWDNIANKKGVVPENDPEITAYNNVPKTLLTWEVDLDKPGDYFEFEVDAVNAGSLDAEITGIESKYDNTSVITTENGVLVEDDSVIPSYIKYSVKYKDNGNKPALGDKLTKASDLTSTPPVYTRKTYVIHVEYDKDAVTPAIVNNMNENGETHTFTFEVTYGQAAPETVEDPCPGCVYAFYTESDKKDCRPSRESTLTDYTDDYTTLKKNGEQRQVFLGHVLGENNVITKFYVCTIIEDKPFCLEGTGSSWNVTDDTLALYNAGKTKLNEIYGSYGAYDSTTKLGCQDRSGGDEYYCSSDKTSSNVYNFGSMSIYGKGEGSSISSYDSCHIVSAGDVYCIER